MKKTEAVIESNMVQAGTAWVEYLNRLRMDALLENLRKQDTDFKAALEELQKFKTSVFSEVIMTNRGGDKGAHGFIAERAQVDISNARNLVQGLAKDYVLIDDNGPVDYLRGNIDIQQKFVQRNLGLGAIRRHLEKYPSYAEQGGIYQIPKDYYEKYRHYLWMPKSDAGKLENDEYRLWKYIQEFEKETGIQPEQIEPAVINYKDAQRGAYEQTYRNEKGNIKGIDKDRRTQYYNEARPTAKEAAYSAGVAAGLEGGGAFLLSVRSKLQEGKMLSEFSSDDWEDVGIATGKGAVKGGIRGASVYGLTNFTVTCAPVASSFVTAVMGTVGQYSQYKSGYIGEEEYLVNSEMVCVEAAISAISSGLGQTLIPVPILGALVGNTVGMVMYQISTEYLDKNEEERIQNYLGKIDVENRRRENEYTEVSAVLREEMGHFRTLADMAFDMDINVAFASSVSMAYEIGVPEKKILKNMREIDEYFLE